MLGIIGLFPNLPGKSALASHGSLEMLGWGGKGLPEFSPSGQRYTLAGLQSSHP